MFECKERYCLENSCSGNENVELISGIIDDATLDMVTSELKGARNFEDNIWQSFYSLHVAANDLLGCICE